MPSQTKHMPIKIRTLKEISRIKKVVTRNVKSLRKNLVYMAQDPLLDTMVESN
jgi:hypothetical protein